jgi:formiminotetrahydrofolate cyclodeaminase
VGGRDFLELSVQEWLEALAAESPAPGGGSAAAMTGATAASIVVMTASASPEWAEGRGVAAQASRLRDRLAELARSDAEAYEASLAALADRGAVPDKRRDFALGTALQRAADPPLAIAETCCDVAVLASVAASNGIAHLQPDAQVAASLAAAASFGAARLVGVNLAITPDDERVRRARVAADRAAAAARESIPPGSVQSGR